MASIKKKLKGQLHINNKITPKPVIKYEVVAATRKKVQDLEGNFVINSDSDIEILPSFHDTLWPKETHLVYPAQGAKIALCPQNPHVQCVARNAIQLLLISICFIDAFPDITLRTKFNRCTEASLVGYGSPKFNSDNQSCECR
jgi:hypothetical protein